VDVEEEAYSQQRTRIEAYFVDRRIRGQHVPRNMFQDRRRRRRRRRRTQRRRRRRT
jgi:hypothetical protein